MLILVTECIIKTQILFQTSILKTQKAGDNIFTADYEIMYLKCKSDYYHDGLYPVAAEGKKNKTI